MRDRCNISWLDKFVNVVMSYQKCTWHERHKKKRPLEYQNVQDTRWLLSFGTQKQKVGLWQVDLLIYLERVYIPLRETTGIHLLIAYYTCERKP